MPEPTEVARACLHEVELPDGEGIGEIKNRDERSVEVQFNPETLKVTYSNTLEGDDQSGGSAIQHVKKSSTKLSVDLWFDTSTDEQARDVRTRTKQVTYFFTPKERGDGLAPPAVRFHWGTFLFEGVMQSLDETLEFFSAQGRPLRAKVAITVASQNIQSRIHENDSSPGTKEQTPATEGEGLQQMLGRQGSAEGWQGVARANGIENPRHLEPGSQVDTSAGRSSGGRRAGAAAGRR